VPEFKPPADPLPEPIVTDAHPAAAKLPAELPVELLAETPLVIEHSPRLLGFVVTGPSGETLYTSPNRSDAERWISENG